MTRRSRARVVLPGEARTIELGAFDVAVLSDGDDEHFSLIETSEASAGVGPPLHVHRDAAELDLYTPSAMIGYFDELAAAIADGVDDATIDDIAARYAMDVVGPVPEGYV